MARRITSLYPGAYAEHISRVFLAATSVSGALYVRHTGTNVGGEVVVATTTGAADFMGIAAETKTYSTTQADFDGYPADEEGTIAMICDPFQVIEMLVSGGTTAGTALNATSPANILTNTSASSGGTTVTAAEVGTIDHSGGILIGRTGNNVGLARRISAHTNNTSTGVTVPFPRALAVSDTFFRFPYSLAVQSLTFTTDIVQADGTTALTGAPFAVIQMNQAAQGGVTLDLVAGSATVTLVSRDHNFNPLS